MADEDPEPWIPCCDYRDHGGSKPACACPEHPRSSLHPFGDPDWLEKRASLVGTLRDLSIQIEQDTGFDSIKTIEEMYELTGRGAYRCCYPMCDWATNDAEKMWKHVHLGPKHNPDGWTEGIRRWAYFLEPILEKEKAARG